MFPPGDDCGEFKSMRLAGGVSTGPLTVDDPEAWFTSVGVERRGAETNYLTGCGRRDGLQQYYHRLHPGLNCEGWY